MRIKAKANHGITYVRVLAKHPMESGLRIDSKSGEVIPAKYIQQITCEHKGQAVLIAQFGIATPKDPFLEFSFQGGKKGDQLTFRWNDNTGASLSSKAVIQ